MNNRLTNDQKQEWAKMLFTRFDLSVSDIALKVEAQEAAVRKWVMDGNWEGLRRSLLTSKEIQLDALYEILHGVIGRIKEQSEGNTKDADLLIKYTAAIKNLETETTISEVIEVARLFISWLQRSDIELAKTVTLYFDAFIKQRLQKN